MKVNSVNVDLTPDEILHISSALQERYQSIIECMGEHNDKSDYSDILNLSDKFETLSNGVRS